MPNLITHIHFGKELQKLLPKEVADACYKYKDAFLFGTIGPDFTFVFRELGGGNDARFANNMHGTKVYEVMTSIARYVSRIKDERVISYVLGLMSHYVADKTIHPYVFSRVENGIQGDLPYDQKQHAHGLIEAAFDTHVSVDILGYADSNLNRPSVDLKTSCATRKAIGELYAQSVCPVLGFKIAPYKFALACQATRAFMAVSTDKSGIKHKIFDVIERRVWKRRRATPVMRPPVGYGKVDYLNEKRAPFATTRNGSETSNMTFDELFDSALKYAVDYLSGFYKAITTDGNLEPMGGLDAFKLNFEGTEL